MEYAFLRSKQLPILGAWAIQQKLVSFAVDGVTVANHTDPCVVIVHCLELSEEQRTVMAAIIAE